MTPISPIRFGADWIESKSPVEHLQKVDNWVINLMERPYNYATNEEADTFERLMDDPLTDQVTMQLINTGGTCKIEIKQAAPSTTPLGRIVLSMDEYLDMAPYCKNENTETKIGSSLIEKFNIALQQFRDQNATARERSNQDTQHQNPVSAGEIDASYSRLKGASGRYPMLDFLN